MTEQPENVFYAMFCDAINQSSLARFATAFDAVSRIDNAKVHLLFQSSGGCVGDGIFLYNIFRTAPFDLTLYNAGTVASIATVAFLGAKSRKCSSYAAFMLHRSTALTANISAQNGAAILRSLEADDERTIAVLRQHITLSEASWATHQNSDLFLSAVDAKDCGIVDEITEFSIPPNCHVRNI